MMSRFSSVKYAGLTPYEPGEQPQNRQYIKLNTNESPFPPSEKALAKAKEAAERLQLYPDPDFRELSARLAETFNPLVRAEGGKPLTSENILVGNGSDEILNFAFMAFCDDDIPAVFPDITYGFYPVFAQINRISYGEVPLKDDFSIELSDYFHAGGTVLLANPNAHTGIALSREEIEKIVQENPDNVVLVDEAYVDFGAESCAGLVGKYDNLIVVQTMSKARSLAGARLGYCLANQELIRDMNTLRNSTNPYNINAMSMAAAEGVLEDEEYTKANCKKVIVNRRYTEKALKSMGFELTDSLGNFIFMKHPDHDGGRIYKEMKARGVLIRHFDRDRIRQYNRVAIGNRRQMEIFLETLKEVIR